MPLPTDLEVLEKAEAYKGIHSWDVSQSHTILGRQAGRGVCFAASCYYISKHKAGGSLREFIGMYLENNKRTFVPLNQKAVGLIKTEQKHFRHFETPAFEAWLNHKSGVKKRGYGGGPVTRMKLVNSILAVNAGYMLFGFMPPDGSGHAVAMYFGTERRGKVPVRFFDVNFGEFLFRDRYEFFCFFEWLLFVGYGIDATSNYRFFHLV